MKNVAFYIICIVLISLYFGITGRSATAVPNDLLDYQEECLSEGCSDEEVRELHSGYTEECLNEGCSKEEVFELGGTASGAIEMMRAFRQHGWDFDPSDFQGIDPFCAGTETSCIGVVLTCNDNCTYPDGSTSSTYVCGACFGFDF